MSKKQKQKQKAAKNYLWFIKLDVELQRPCLVIAALKKMEVRELVSDIVREKLFEVKTQPV